MANFSKNKIIAGAVGVVLLVILGLYFTSKPYRTDKAEPWKFGLDNNPDEANWFYKTYKSYMTNGANGENGVNGTDKTNKTNRTDGMNNDDISKYQSYTHPTYGFSFQYPQDFNISSFEDGEGETVLVKSQNPNPKSQTNSNDQNSNSKNQEIQIYISSFDEPESLTYERLKKDIPDLVIEDPKILTFGGGAKALLFFSRDGSLGRTREVWFVFDKNLYQITTYADMDPILENIIKSWSFN